jgi:hypothetical protein
MYLFIYVVKNINKYTEKNCASRWSFTKNHYMMHGQQNIKKSCLHVTSFFLYMPQLLGQKRENRITCTNVFQLFLSTSFQQGLHVFAVGCRDFFRGLISMFAFDILQIPNGCNHISSGYSAHTCTPLATNLLTGVGCNL